MSRYWSRISGPLRDRFDLQVRVGAVDAGALVGDGAAAARNAVDLPGLLAAHRAQGERARRLGLPQAFNARLPARLLPEAVQPSREAERLLVERARGLGLTGRGVHRVLRVARTVADLASASEVDRRHVEEALGLRGE